MSSSISKQGNRLMRMLLAEAATVVVRYDPEFSSEYLHRCHHKPKAVAKVAAARKSPIRLFWMLRTYTPYPGGCSHQEHAAVRTADIVVRDRRAGAGSLGHPAPDNGPFFLCLTPYRMTPRKARSCQQADCL